jgi:CO/xanthine dehydrogenase FAD-binding subunit
MDPFAYHRPRSLEEAGALKAAAPDATFVAGGTDLLVRMRRGGAKAPSALISLRAVPELAVLEASGSAMRVGAAVPVADVARHPTVRAWFPALAGALGALGSRQVQNVATVGGNLCRAAPCADSAPPLLVHEARVELWSPRGTRVIPLPEFFRGPGVTARADDEILAAILLERPPAGAGTAFLRRSRVRMDLSTANLAALVVVDRGACTLARVAAGSVAPVPLRLRETERALAGSRLDDATVARASEIAMGEVLPITDVRSTAEYRRHLVGVFLGRAVRRAHAAARGEGTP